MLSRSLVRKSAIAILTAVVASFAVSLALVGRADAQALVCPTGETHCIELNPSILQAHESATPTISWRTSPAGATCVANGAWTGTKAASGSELQARITSTKSYGLECTWPSNLTAKLKWTAPTQNTDNSAFSNPNGVVVKYGRNAAALDQEAVVNSPSPPLTQHDLVLPSTGTWYFAIAITNTTGGQSDLSNVVSKVLSDVKVSRSTSVTVNPVPKAVTDLTVE